MNTLNEDVLACVFNQMPIDYPHGGATRRISRSEAARVGRTIVQRRSSEFTSLSQLGWTNLWTLAGLAASARSDLDRESLVRNSAGLLHTRQNFFTILLFAQLTRNVEMDGGVFEKMVVTEVRGIAEVWRDPVEDTYLLRTFKILNE